MKQIVIAICQTSAIGTAAFILLLCFKQVILRRCDIRVWMTVLLVSTTLFILPLSLLKALISPWVLPIRVWLQKYASEFTHYQSNGVAIVTVPSELVYQGIIIAWGLGILIYLAVRWSLYLSYASRLKSESRIAPVFAYDIFVNRVLPKNLSRFSRLKHVKLYCHDDLLSPIVYGVWHKKIVLPGKIIEEYDADEIYLMLRHEFLHITHCDAEKRLLFLIAHALNWFNPLLFLLERHINEALELHCDMETIENREDAQARLQYGELLILLKDNQRRHVMGLHMANRKFMQKRLVFIMSQPQKTNKLLTVFVAFALALLILMFLMGFSIQYNHEQYINPHTNVDYAETAQLKQWAALDNFDDGYSFSENGEYIVEQYLYHGTVNFVEHDFLTKTTKMTLTLLDGNNDVCVYLYNSRNKENPLMQIFLNQASVPLTFSGLSSNALYSLGLIVDDNSDVLTRISISD